MVARGRRIRIALGVAMREEGSLMWESIRAGAIRWSAKAGTGAPGAIAWGV